MSALNKTFTPKLRKSPNRGGWTYVIMPGSAKFFSTRGLVRVAGPSTGIHFEALWPLATVRTNCRSKLNFGR